MSLPKFLVRLENNAPASSGKILYENFLQLYPEYNSVQFITEFELNQKGFASLVLTDAPVLENPFEFCLKEDIPTEKDSQNRYIQKWKICEIEFEDNEDKKNANKMYFSHLKKSLKNKINDDRFAKEHSDFIVDSIIFDVSNQNKQLEFYSLSMFAKHFIDLGEPNNAIVYRDKENIEHEISSSKFFEYFISYQSYKNELYKKSWQNKRKIDLTETIDEVLKIKNEIGL